MDEAARVCARLLASGTLPREVVPELDYIAVRSEVEHRLQQCGLALATSAYTDYVGLRISPEASDPSVLDSASNLNLGKDAYALLTVLWARLVLQRRTAEDTRTTPGERQIAILQEDERRAAREYVPSVHYETLVQEFGQQFGGVTRLKTLLGRLRNLQFITYRTLAAIQAGPMLELGIDGERMVSFIRTRVLSQLMAERASEDESAMETAAVEQERVLLALNEAAEPLSFDQLEDLTGIPFERLNDLVESMRMNGQVATAAISGEERVQLPDEESG